MTKWPKCVSKLLKFSRPRRIYIDDRAMPINHITPQIIFNYLCWASSYKHYVKLCQCTECEFAICESPDLNKTFFSANSFISLLRMLHTRNCCFFLVHFIHFFAMLIAYCSMFNVRWNLHRCLFLEAIILRKLPRCIQLLLDHFCGRWYELTLNSCCTHNTYKWKREKKFLLFSFLRISNDFFFLKLHCFYYKVNQPNDFKIKWGKEKINKVKKWKRLICS